MPRLTSHHGARTSVYWWTEEIAELRTSCKRAQTALRGTRAAALRSIRAGTFRQEKRTLRKAINASKRRCTEKLATTLETKEMTAKPTLEVDAVNQKQEKKIQSVSSFQYNRCGREHRRRMCPAFNKECEKC
ncbi:hypothetical protein LOC100643140 [Anopheles sinensis]|uniref:Uncharacterized protein n=1 Tax=Anopheles sinensis TaxID=74873 RepID=A0A084VJM8_ANOSI|nr:hypothetical protein LOC100643140 [Anopheles sinensis]